MFKTCDLFLILSNIHINSLLNSGTYPHHFMSKSLNIQSSEKPNYGVYVSCFCVMIFSLQRISNTRI